MNELNKTWNAVVRETASSTVAAEEFTLRRTMRGASADNDCKGAHPDDAGRKWKTACVSSSF